LEESGVGPVKQFDAGTFATENAVPSFISTQRHAGNALNNR
jgi:hypothetical protein